MVIYMYGQQNMSKTVYAKVINSLHILLENLNLYYVYGS